MRLRFVKLVEDGMAYAASCSWRHKRRDVRATAAAAPPGGERGGCSKGRCMTDTSYPDFISRSRSQPSRSCAPPLASSARCERHGARERRAGREWGHGAGVRPATGRSRRDDKWATDLFFALLRVHIHEGAGPFGRLRIACVRESQCRRWEAGSYTEGTGLREHCGVNGW